MTEPDVEKRKKGKRRRSARTYVNIDRLTPDEIRERLAAVAEFFPSDPDEDDTSAMAKPDRVKRNIGQAERKRLAAAGRAVVNGDGHISYPVAQGNHEDAQNALALIRSGHGDTAAAARMLRRVARKEGWRDIVDALDGKEPAQKAVAGDPVGMHGSLVDRRVSPPLGPGHAAYGVGDHGAAMGTTDPMNQPGPKALALGHPSMRQGTTTPQPLFSMRTDATPFPADLRNLDSGIGIRVSRLDAAAATGLTSAPGNPAMRLGSHIAQGSATPPNGSHGLSSPACPPTGAMKNSDRVALMKEFMFGNGGRR